MPITQLSEVEVTARIDAEWDGPYHGCTPLNSVSLGNSLNLSLQGGAAGSEVVQIQVTPTTEYIDVEVVERDQRIVHRLTSNNNLSFNSAQLYGNCTQDYNIPNIMVVAITSSFFANKGLLIEAPKITQVLPKVSREQLPTILSSHFGGLPYKIIETKQNDNFQNNGRPSWRVIVELNETSVEVIKRREPNNNTGKPLIVVTIDALSGEVLREEPGLPD